MKRPPTAALSRLWGRHDADLRSPAQIAGQWQQAHETDPNLLRYTTRGKWWETLDACGITLLVTREYEHLVVAMKTGAKKPFATYMRLPHPSGMAVDRARGIVHIASTRNPNQVFDFRPTGALLPRLDLDRTDVGYRPLVPVKTRFYPGCFYLHDLALIGPRLHGNAVGQNAVVALDDAGGHERVWWPKCIETPDGPLFGRNHLQLNSIAAGSDIEGSFFSASVDRPTARRPAHKNFLVDRRGVLFSGRTRDVIARGLTRPHSARLYGGRLWVDDSGYGTVGFVEAEKFRPVLRLPGWTRGLCFHEKIMFVGTSRVIPRFRHYAPGLDVEDSVCGLHAIDAETGRVLGSLLWPYGNQIFAIDWVPAAFADGFVFRSASKRSARFERTLFYAYDLG